MGIETRKPPLPAPTESSTLQTSGGSGEEADLATDVSRRTDRTSYSIPEDGSPVTIPTKKRRDSRDKGRESALTHASHHSQTSLLIEYFEGGKGPNVHSRPSVRVKVTPSAARKIKDTNEHVQVTASKGSRKPSYTRRISLGQHSTGERQATESADDKSISSYTSAAEESSLAHRYPPVEVEIMHRDQDSDLSGLNLAREERYTHVNPSDISSMPPDSMLEGKAGSVTPRRGSRSTSRDAVVTTDTLKTPSRRRSRSLSKERLAHKAMEKLVERPREVSGGKHKRSSKTRSRSGSNEQLVEDVNSRRRRSSKGYREEELASGAESSLLTTSQLSPRRESGDQYSFRSGTSKSSINANPRLLETVENAIRRLIMPELETLKQEQKMQQSRQKFDRDSRGSVDSGRSVSHTELSRKLSKHASAPDVSGKPKVFLNRDEHNAGTLLSGDSIKGRKESRRDRKSDSPSERRSERDMSEETVIRDGEKPSRKRSKEHRLKDTTAGAIAGGILTAAALNHHDLKHNDSRSSMDREKRRRRRSKGSHSRSASIAESTEEIFNKHDVPPMPMRSDIQSSEVTRDSILSEQTDGTLGTLRTLSPSEERIHTAEIRQVSRGSPREILSPASRTPTRTPQDARRGGLGTYHSNLSQGDLAEASPHSNRSFRDDEHHSKLVEAGVVGAVAGTAGLTAHNLSDRNDQYDRHGFAYQQESRGLSPIQSVSSRQESEINRQSFGHKGSLSSLKQPLKKDSAASMRSLASPVSVDMTRSNRPKGINFEPGEDVLAQLRDSKFTEGEYSDKDPAMDEWLEQEHEKNDRYRDSGSYRDSMIDYKHMTNYTDDSMDAPYLDKVAAAQERHTVGVGRNPDYRSTPVAVESAVASLLETSVISSKQEDRSYAGSREQERVEADAEREVAQNSREQQHEHQTKSSSEKHYSYDRLSAKDSPRQSIARSLDEREEHIPMGASGLPVADDPIPEIGHGLHSDSEISTNPSIIQGPMGGYQNDNLDHWPNKPTPPQAKGEFLSPSKDSSAQDSLKAAAAGFLNAATLASGRGSLEEQGKSREMSIHDDYQPRFHDDYETNAKHDFSPVRETYMAGGRVPSPPKDEGYISGPQRGAASPEIRFRDAKAFNDRGRDGMTEDEDPFISRGHDRHLSTNSHGLAHGMGSPLYDSATGGGIDRIQSKDIVALMDHLTVRDAQRNARDTEILVTLVRSAAEMRNSFEEMKKFIAEQDDLLVDVGNKQHDRTIQKIVVGGPRPQPLGPPKYQRRSSTEDDAEDSPAKRRNVFRRALKGLSSRNQNDIGKIEEMLVHLLGEVEGLKAVQGVRPAGGGDNRADSLNSYNNMRAAGPDGYEPEGQAGTGSTGQSGYFSNPPSREASAMRNRDSRRGSQNRVSTVLEADEEPEPHEQGILDNHNEQLLTPTRENARAGSVPLGTPPQTQVPNGTQSNEHTPRTGTDKSRKHKSSSSSFFPKISRWSRTTASSVGDNFRNSMDRRQQRPFSEASRSGEDLQPYETNDHYDHHGDDRIRSNDSLENDDVVRDVAQENRPPSPLIPSEVSEDPKYQAHRNSLNLQHPQPRPGPTHRFQHHLESQAQNFGSRSPISPTSDTFGSDPTLARYVPGAINRYSGLAGNLSPISDAGHSETSGAEQASAPPRPPKVKDDGPLIPSGPSRPPKLASKDSRPTFASPLSTEHLQPEQRYSNGSAYDTAKDSPRSTSGAAMQRKPTGPRPITSSGSYSPDKESVKRNRYRGSPNQIPSPTEEADF
ncbi:hypothetical protein HO133_005678 [Letharia lupina]|uniref:Uncharacterized protein n=1 Tax=Letharia lupina TaxID=560253 RepID=A0A8H6F7Z1_9LECA|nr:uncharacterized protein HO133_005678 [Letharia lupina]KAF6218331.1 hypothetical protein HO133_005678 [Letharia lupina]